MSTPVFHKCYEVTAYPERAVTPDILYLRVGDEIYAAAAQTVNGWRIFLYESDVETIVGSNVGDLDNALGWLHALGQAATA